MIAASAPATPSKMLTLKYVLSYAGRGRDVILIGDVRAGHAVKVVGRLIEHEPQHAPRHGQDHRKGGQRMRRR